MDSQLCSYPDTCIHPVYSENMFQKIDLQTFPKGFQNTNLGMKFVDSHRGLLLNTFVLFYQDPLSNSKGNPKQLFQYYCLSKTSNQADLNTLN